MGTPEEIAAAVLWLCSDAASFVLGHAMVIDGGQTIQPSLRETQNGSPVGRETKHTLRRTAPVEIHSAIVLLVDEADMPAHTVSGVFADVETPQDQIQRAWREPHCGADTRHGACRPSAVQISSKAADSSGISQASATRSPSMRYTPAVRQLTRSPSRSTCPSAS